MLVRIKHQIEYIQTEPRRSASIFQFGLIDVRFEEVFGLQRCSVYRGVWLTEVFVS